MLKQVHPWTQWLTKRSILCIWSTDQSISPDWYMYGTFKVLLRAKIEHIYGLIVSLIKILLMQPKYSKWLPGSQNSTLKLVIEENFYLLLFSVVMPTIPVSWVLRLTLLLLERWQVSQSVKASRALDGRLMLLRDGGHCFLSDAPAYCHPYIFSVAICLLLMVSQKKIESCPAEPLTSANTLLCVECSTPSQLGKAQRSPDTLQGHINIKPMAFYW